MQFFGTVCLSLNFKFKRFAMLGSQRQSIDDYLVQAVADRPGRSAVDLIEHVSKKLRRRPLGVCAFFIFRDN